MSPVAPVPLLEDLKVEPFFGRHVVYLIHFHEPLKHARHYVGYTADLKTRLRLHRHGDRDSSCLMRAIHAAGISWTVSRVWAFETKTEALTHEKRLKKARNLGCCPLCRREIRRRARESMRRHRAKLKTQNGAPHGN